MSTGLSVVAGARRSPVRWYRAAAGLLLLPLLGLGACEGDTLYDGTPVDPGNGPGPEPPPPSGEVSGMTIDIPGEGTVADLLVDPASGQVFVSNHSQHRIEVLNLETMEFGAAVPVGAEPWGMELNRTGDTLIVANSGGTNISLVPTATLQEDVARRFEIPRITLYQTSYSIDEEAGDTTFTDIVFFNYADRPQHVAQDYQGRLLYSAISTVAAPIGSIRLADFGPGYEEWDARMLFHNKSRNFAETTVTIANADSMVMFSNGDAIFWDHVPGSVPRRPLVNDQPARLLAAAAELNSQGADIDVRFETSWRLPEGIALADTNYVVASGDRRSVLIGEGTRGPSGRLMMWSAELGALSQVEAIADIVNNTADAVFGIDLNENGSLGVALGLESTYFFGNDLRLQGLTDFGGVPSGRGAALLPGSTSNRTLAFVGTGRRSVQVVETTHYRPIGEIPVRENIIGPLRSSAPLDASTACPADLAQGEPDCVVATVYGLTTGRRVLVLDVLLGDLEM